LEMHWYNCAAICDRGYKKTKGVLRTAFV